MFFIKESANSVFRSVNNRPEFKIIVPDGYSARLSMMLLDGCEESFRFPNPKPSFEELFDKRTAWRPFRISFVDNGMMVSFSNRSLGLDPNLPLEELDADIKHRDDHSISRTYASFCPCPDGMEFIIELLNPDNEIVEEYIVYIEENSVTIEAYTGYDDSDHKTTIIPR